MAEARLSKDLNWLLCLNDSDIDSKRIGELKARFCGQVCLSAKDFRDRIAEVKDRASARVYVCGRLKGNLDKLDLTGLSRVSLVKELCPDYQAYAEQYSVIGIGELPKTVHELGVFFPKLFNTDKDLFGALVKEHEFQSLTESNKPGRAFRKGIYLTEVEERDEGLAFKLLRCSTNFDGPTDNYRDTDHEIVSKVNDCVRACFEAPAELNHTLAQIYVNKVREDKGRQKEKKAKIKLHSDKTKDMPENGLIAFVTLYQVYAGEQFHDPRLAALKPSKSDPYDLCYKDRSVYTKLRFRRKSGVTDESLVPSFEVTLYPNSLFVISLRTNRLYGHEIVPSAMPIDKLPTRMGYVIRCSNKEAVHKRGTTYLIDGEQELELQAPSFTGVKKLKDLYFKENTSTEPVIYEEIDFSLNKGDYCSPIL